MGNLETDRCWPTSVPMFNVIGTMFSNIGRHRLLMFSVTPYMGTDTKQHRSTWVTNVQRHLLDGYGY